MLAKVEEPEKKKTYTDADTYIKQYLKEHNL